MIRPYIVSTKNRNSGTTMHASITAEPLSCRRNFCKIRPIQYPLYISRVVSNILFVERDGTGSSCTIEPDASTRSAV